jgi:hypothetical protein
MEETHIKYLLDKRNSYMEQDATTFMSSNTANLDSDANHMYRKKLRWIQYVRHGIHSYSNAAPN